MRINPNRGSFYLDSHSSEPVGKHRPRGWSFALSLILALGVLASGLSFISPATPSPVSSLTAYAETECEEDEKCDEKTLTESFDDTKYGENEAGFQDLMDDLLSNPEKANNPDSILYAFQRHFTVGYMNEGDKATIAGKDFDDESLNWYKDIFKSRGKYNCGKGYGGAGSKFPGEAESGVHWHNCDVPNLLTEFVQDVAVLFFQPGFTKGTTEASYTSTSWFGFSSSTPTTVDQNGGQNFTALEVFGYNMKYTTYNGEWDHIKVMTAARALSNFGFLDKLKLGAQAILNGILGGVNAAVNGLVADLKSGNIVRIITAPLRFIGNLFGGGVSSTVDTVIDTSDTNVFATMSWYRPTFGATLYNARALSQDEIVEYIQLQLAKYIQKIAKEREKAKIPPDLAAISPDKLAAISPPSTGGCTATGTYKVGNAAPVAVNWTFPLSTANSELCAGEVTNKKKEIIALEAPATVIFDLTTSFGPSKTVSQWIAEAGVEAAIEQYGILCSITGSDSSDPAAVNTFIECMENPEAGWPAAVARETLNEQTKLDEKWFEEYFQADAMVGFFRKQAASFTAPNAKYICLTPNGKDMRVDGNYVKLVIGSKGTTRYNPLCDPVRSPIQNGLFGNGYEGAQPPIDTRRSAFDPSTWVERTMSNGISAFSLSIAVFSTRLSNTVLNLAFAPILETIGADTIITNLIIGFRDSLFFPLAILIIAIGAISIFFQAGVRRDFGAQGKSLLLIVGVFFLGTILMADPYRTVRFVDQAPAQAEAVVVGAVFEVGNREDPLCNASSSASSVGGQDFFGNTIDFDPSASTRNLLCENWRVFAFNTYVQGQWGTSYDNLNINEFSASGSQATLVGNGEGKAAPYVPLGGGGNNAERNWALYQLDVLTSGTTTTQDAQNSKVIDPNLYRLVDLQAGPGGELTGAPYDSRHFDAWSGADMGSRMTTSTLGALTSVVGMAAVSVFAFAKIQISLMATFMLLFMPFMFLLGLFPSQGRLKLKTYFMQLFSLMVQRVVLVALLALMLRVITTVASSTDNFFYYTVMTIATCVAFLAYRKEILQLFDKSINKGGGKSNFEIGEYMPKSVRHTGTRAYKTARYAAFGGLGGFMAGGVSGAQAGARDAAKRQGALLTMKQAREGFGPAQIAMKARKSVQREGQGELDTYQDTTMKGVAENKARETLANEGLSEDLINERLADQTKLELDRMKPEGGRAKNAQYRRLGAMKRTQSKVMKPDTRSTRELRRDMKDAVSDRSTDPTDRIVERAQEIKPKLTDNTKHIEEYRSAVDRFAANAEENYVRSGEEEAQEAYRQAKRDDRIVSTLRGAVREDEEGDLTTFADREAERIAERTTSRAYIRDSAKDIMREFRIEVEETLTEEDKGRDE